MTTQQKQTLREVVSTRMLYIPDYQRPFAWEYRQLRDLWDDLDLAGPDGKHYAGTLVFRPSDPADFTIDRWGDEARHTDVVDGQQRLTTCLLLLDRMRRRFEILANAGVEDATTLAHDLVRYYGILEAEDFTKKLRLKPGHEVEDYWRCLLSDRQYVGTELASHRRLKYAAKFFDERLDEILAEEDDATSYRRLRDLYRRVVTNLQFLVYEVESLADVGVIFETLNDRGHPLSELEKTKNYLLYLARQIQPPTLGNDLAEQLNKDWATIFANLADAGSDAENQLLRAHWLATRNPDPRTWKGVASIKKLFARNAYIPGSVRLRPQGTDSRGERVEEERWKDLDQAVREFALELAECSAYLRDSLNAHASYSSFGVHADRVRDRAAALQRSGIVATYRPLLFAMRLQHPNDGARYAELISLCECYSARLLVILQFRTNAGQNRLYSLGNQLFHGISPDQVLDDIRRLLLFWADDTKLTAKLKDTTEDWYNRSGHKYFLYEYELHLSPAGGTVFKFDTFTVGAKVPARTTEHIYPQSPEDDSWTKVFVTPEEVALKHSLGNLVLTLDNSSYGRKPFLAKRGMPLTGGRTPNTCYAQSSLKQEQELTNYDDWTPTTIQQRQEKLAEWALTRWHVDDPAGPATQPTVEPDADPEFDDAEADVALTLVASVDASDSSGLSISPTN